MLNAVFPKEQTLRGKLAPTHNVRQCVTAAKQFCASESKNSMVAQEKVNVWQGKLETMENIAREYVPPSAMEITQLWLQESQTGMAAQQWACVQVTYIIRHFLINLSKIVLRQISKKIVMIYCNFLFCNHAVPKVFGEWEYEDCKIRDVDENCSGEGEKQRDRKCTSGTKADGSPDTCQENETTGTISCELDEAECEGNCVSGIFLFFVWVCNKDRKDSFQTQF